MYMPHTPLFGVNSVVTVIISSKDYILKIYDMVIIRHHFSVRIQLWQSSCHLKTTFWKYMIWSSPGIIFQCEFSCDSHHVIWRLHFENIWYGHHQASFFSANSVVTVIMSSEDYILKIYDMVNRCHFSFLLMLPWSMTDVFWNFGIACEIKFDKLPKYLGRWSTPKTGGSHFGPKELDQ